MPRLLAIDYGKKRVGLAVTDPLQLIAQGLTTVPTLELIAYLKKYFEQEPVEAVVIGLPKNLRNEDTDATALVQHFIEVFKRQFPHIPLHTLDERFTSKMAFQSLIDSGVKKKERQNKGLIDTVSATIILQSFMEQRR